jgi:DNA-binding CsgD family transcriptional regulator
MAIDVPTRGFVVYAHSIGGEVFYVGHGKPTRPFDLGGRNLLWREAVTRATKYEVAILSHHATKEAANIAEMDAIERLSPRANIRRRRKPRKPRDPTTKQRGPGRTIMGANIVRLLKQGEKPRDIAKRLGCTASAVRYYRKYLRGPK